MSSKWWTHKHFFLSHKRLTVLNPSVLILVERKNVKLQQWPLLAGLSRNGAAMVSFPVEASRGPNFERNSGEGQNPSCLKSSVDLRYHLISWCWSTVFYPTQSQCNHLTENSRPSCFMEMLILFSSQQAILTLRQKGNRRDNCGEKRWGTPEPKIQTI